jgi:S-adenosylmethionine decarboxylase
MTHAFEGPEKKLELVLRPGRPSLRDLGQDFWEEVVRAAGAQILSRRSNQAQDAYLLSESSLFVFADRLTLITCGQTRLVEAALRIVDRVGPDHVALLILERKNEHFPWAQPSTFAEDARQLAEVIGGEALRFGRQDSHSVSMFHTTRPFVTTAADTTIEVLMHGIAPEVAAGFVGGALPESARALAELLPGYAVDDHVFEPAGYSLNAISDECYYTLHVTPEAVGSYVSFESNFDFRAEGARALVGRVVEHFRPETFDVLTFVPEGEPLELEIPGYRRRQHVAQALCGYQVTYLHLYRPPRSPAAATSLGLG